MLIAAEDQGQGERPPLPPLGKGPDGPDTRTCARLVSFLVESGEVTLSKLQYNQELVATTREVCGVVWYGVEYVGQRGVVYVWVIWSRAPRSVLRGLRLWLPGVTLWQCCVP